MKKTIITALLAIVALAGWGQEVKPQGECLTVIDFELLT